MKDYSSATYGDHMVDHDVLGWPMAKDEHEAAGFLVDFVRDGAALELGVGTGRMAFALAEHGVPVVGVDASSVMLDQLKSKLAGQDIQVVQGDFADVGVSGEFDLVYCVQHTFFFVPTQAAQVRCFREVAARLAPGGRFALQLFVPDPNRLIEPQSTDVLQVGVDQVVLRVSKYDNIAQTVDRQYMMINSGGTRLFPMSFRYAWPAELDLMAAMAGLVVEGRWAGWDRGTYTGSGRYVVVYRKDDAAARP